MTIGCRVSIQKPDQPRYYGELVGLRADGTTACVRWDNPFIGTTEVKTEYLQEEKQDDPS